MAASDRKGKLKVEGNWQCLCSMHNALHTFAVLNAKGLIAADSGNHSDPFVEIKLGTHTLKTQTIMKTLDPVWNESFDLYAISIIDVSLTPD